MKLAPLLFLILTSLTTSAQRIVITEFMADPNPVVGLPDEEYVELFNAGSNEFPLTELQIGTGTRPRDVVGDILPAGGYLVITDVSALTNGGDVITLINAGDTIFEITYTDDWYNDPERDGGGYSIAFTGDPAQASPEAFDCAANWRASLDPSGGTPGSANGVLGQPVDTQAPRITEVNVDSAGITLVFDEAPIISGGLRFLALLNGLPPAGASFLDEITVRLEQPIAEGEFFTLTVLPDFSDCAGNFAPDELNLELGIPGRATPGDVVINEVLFNPNTGGSDFLELFNCSDKILQIEDWTLENSQSTASTAVRRVGESRLFLPGQYLTFSPEPQTIRDRFTVADTSLLLDQTLPTLPDDEGNITVRAADGTVLDAFDYTEDFHSELLSPDDGVSLERLRAKQPTQDGNNWFSAASSAGFGTPTAENSQARRGNPSRDGAFNIVDETFSPNGDGFQDILELSYRTEQTGFLARVTIYDAQGRVVRRLRRTELLGTEGTLRWDGADDDGQRARTGAYVLLVELFAPDGRTETQKLVAALAAE